MHTAKLILELLLAVALSGLLVRLLRVPAPFVQSCPSKIAEQPGFATHSRIVTVCPARARRIALAEPAVPAPTTPMRNGRSTPPCY